MALTADVIIQSKGGTTERKSALTNVADVYYKGALLMFSATGYLIVCADTASCTFAGVCVRQVTLATGSVEVEFEEGIFRVAFGSAAQGDVGDVIYATADDTIAKTATNVAPMGKCVGFETGYLWVDTRKAWVS
jgi:hypothetical protein